MSAPTIISTRKSRARRWSAGEGRAAKRRDVSPKLDTRDKDAKKGPKGGDGVGAGCGGEATEVLNGSGGLVEKVVRESYARDERDIARRQQRELPFFGRPDKETRTFQ